ncbi:MAG: YesL family protein [Eubacterium sp.]|nr:YesL family protein [Eubacterium sp.]
MFSPDSLFSRFMNTLLDIIVIGLLWLICSLPVVTIVASTTAAYYAMAKVVRHKTGYVFKEFFRSFKANLKQSVLPVIIFIIVIAVIVMDVIYVWNNRSKTNDALFVILVGIAFLFLSCSVYFCPFLSRFTKRNRELFRLSAFSAFRFLPITAAIIIAVIIAGMGLYLMPWMIVFLPGIIFFFLTYPMEYVMRAFMKKPEKGSPEEDIWYNQKPGSIFSLKSKDGKTKNK